jgi:2-polyprenylphenol 6-hydroxylase
VQPDVDIVIVGGGMAGGMLAAALVPTGLKVLLLDAMQAPQMPEHEAGLRVSALTLTSERLLQRVGVWPHLPSVRLQPYQRMDVRDGDGTGEVHFNAAEAGVDHLGTLVENESVVAAMYQHCSASPNIEWRCETRVMEMSRLDNRWQVALVGGDVFRCRLLVGADGARSMVRSVAGLQASPRDTGHVAIVATLATAQPHQGCARQVFLDSGPLALLPLFGDGHRCSLVWSVWPDVASELMALSKEAFCSRLSQASQDWLGDMQLCDERQTFPIQDHHAGAYVAEGVALIGDAAHVVHPLAGQGINMGLLDAAVLAEEIRRALEADRDWHSYPLLQRYERRRRGHNALMVSAMRGFKLVFEQRSPMLRFIRNVGMNLVDRHFLLKGLLSRQAVGQFDDTPVL